MLGAPEGDGFIHQPTSHVHVSLTEVTAGFLEAYVTVWLVHSNRKEYKQKMLIVTYFVCDLANAGLKGVYNIFSNYFTQLRPESQSCSSSGVNVVNSNA